MQGYKFFFPFFISFFFGVGHVPLVSNNNNKNGWDTREAMSHAYLVSGMYPTRQMSCPCFPAHKILCFLFFCFCFECVGSPSAISVGKNGNLRFLEVSIFFLSKKIFFFF